MRTVLEVALLLVIFAAGVALIRLRARRHPSTAAHRHDAIATATVVEDRHGVTVTGHYLTPAAALGAAVERLGRDPGRHRRPDGDVPDGLISATGLLRRVRADEHALPAIPRPTGRQLARRPE